MIDPGFDHWDEIDRENRRKRRTGNFLLVCGCAAVVLAVLLIGLAYVEGAERRPVKISPPIHCLPASIIDALARTRVACGITVISTYRKNAMIAGTNHRSMHAVCRAADFTSRDYPCVYRVLDDWRGKLSNDPYSIGHVHIDDGPYARFAHRGARRYAKRREQAPGPAALERHGAI